MESAAVYWRLVEVGTVLCGPGGSMSLSEEPCPLTRDCGRQFVESTDVGHDGYGYETIYDDDQDDT